MRVTRVAAIFAHARRFDQSPRSTGGETGDVTQAGPAT